MMAGPGKPWISRLLILFSLLLFHPHLELSRGQEEDRPSGKECSSDQMTGDCLRGILYRYSSSEFMNYDQFRTFLGNIGLGSGDSDNDDDVDIIAENFTSIWDEPPIEKHRKCLSPSKLLATIGLHPADIIDASQFLKLCPVLVQQIDVHACQTKELHDVDPPSEKEIRYTHEVWGFSIAAITVISLASLLCILMVPCIQQYPVAFQRLLGLLVALAVGTLSGDAILHLIPHSFIPHGHSEQSATGSPGEDHSDNPSSTSTDRLVIFKGLAVLAGVFLFFMFEQILQLFTQSGRSLASEKGFKALTNGEGEMDAKPSDPEVFIESPTSPRSGLFSEDSQSPLTVTFRMGADLDMEHPSGKGAAECSAMAVATHVVHGHGHSHGHTHGHRHSLEHTHEHTHGHSHEHSHGHSHGVGSMPISSVAWIVVLGDSMHNFCDGIVVGSAFVDSFAGGLSTAIAIMCHEIPHELGDFAVLLKGGMSIKQALLVQLVSSILAYIGMAIGVIVGNANAGATWMFALAAGMFLYISLVDLVPEMVESSKTCTGSRVVYMALQIVGVSLGIGLMLTIALYEPQLLELLGG